MLKTSRMRTALGGALLLALLAACGGEGDGLTAADPTTPNETLRLPADGMVTGKVTGLPEERLSAAVENVEFDTGTELLPADLAADGSFAVAEVPDGDGSLLLILEDGSVVEIPCRMAARRGLDLGEISLAADGEAGFTGFNGYRFGWVDADGDGINDNFVDADGDGICDAGPRYAGYAYRMGLGWADADGDGINDRFVDADGDGTNDLAGRGYGHGFGWTDADGDGINDHFVDADGDGICDLSGMPFSHGFGWVDADGDGINDNFVDADGDGICDLSGRPYDAMPGWVDADGNGINDRFVDADGDGINDLAPHPMAYGHGFGWTDADGDGVNDHFVDADGDGVNDLAYGPYAHMAYRYGALGPHRDGNGDGFDDLTGMPFRHGFGWTDADGDGINDRFADTDGDGIDERFGCGYLGGFRAGAGPAHGGPWGEPDMPGMAGPGGMMNF